MKIKCLIIDDEPLAQKGITEYVNDVEFLELNGVFENALKAIDVIHQKKIDLIFLDIQMPRISGLEFLKALQDPPLVILTTAYPQYAVQGYDLDVIDYLVKPISFQRFLKAVNKAKHFLADKVKDLSQMADENDYFFLKINHQVEKIVYKDVLFIEALQNYVAIHLHGKKLVSYITISNLEKQLPGNLFMRIHKSYIAALHKIEMITKNKVTINNRELPVSRNIKDKLMLAVGNKLVKK